MFYKKMILIIYLLIMIGLEPIFAQDLFYYSNNKKIFIEKDNSVITLVYKDDKKDKNESSSYSGLTDIKKVKISHDKRFCLIKLKSKPSYSISELLNEGNIDETNLSSYTSGYVYKDGSTLFSTDRIVCKLKSGIKFKSLEELFKNEVVFEKESYGRIILRVNDIRNVSDVANSIYQSGIVQWAHPDFIAEIVKDDEDPLYSNQYYLSNTGQLGG